MWGKAEVMQEVSDSKGKLGNEWNVSSRFLTDKALVTMNECLMATN